MTLSLKILLTWNGEGGHDPAVGVQHVPGDAVVDAGDGGADQVIAGDQEARDEQDGRGGPVMQLEERGVDLCLGAPVASLDQPGHRHQQPHDGHGGDTGSQVCKATTYFLFPKKI